MECSNQRYVKTSRAWDALTWPDRLGREKHTVLLLANGRRSEQELMGLLGADVKELLQRLQQEGFLQCTTAPGGDDAAAGM
jgi:hypothetical protein